MAGAAHADTMRTREFSFVSDGRRLYGLLDEPANTAQGLVIIVHGYGRTDVAGQTSWYDIRSRFTALGLATAIWDKPGCGKSEGAFDANQPVQGSAREVLDAVQVLRDTNVPGAHKIVLWGISRAGWIAPLAMSQDPRLNHWISVSGTDDKENFPYLLETNLRIDGRGEADIERLLAEWRRGFAALSGGGSYADYLSATQTLRADPFMVYFNGGTTYPEAAFLSDQKAFLSGAATVDKATGLQVYVPGFADVLSSLDANVLALFGEKDSNIDWRKTSALYTRTIGKTLTVKTFADGNHNIQHCRTGGFREMMEMTERRACLGYYEAMDDWLRAHVLT
jgi:alpha/beta superfamily hydrolase